MGKIGIGLAGGFGGIAANLIALGHALSDGALAKWYGGNSEFWLAFLSSALGWTIFFGIGAAIALALGEKQHIKAVMIGISTPALIAAWVNPAELSGDTRSKIALLNVFTKSAFAQDGSSGLPGQLTLGWQHGAADPSNGAPMEYRFYDMYGNVIAVGVLRQNEATSILIPPNSAKFGVLGPNSNPVTIDLPNTNSPIGYNVEVDRKYINDFLKSLGKRSAEPYDIGLSPRCPPYCPSKLPVN